MSGVGKASSPIHESARDLAGRVGVRSPQNHLAKHNLRAEVPSKFSNFNVLLSNPSCYPSSPCVDATTRTYHCARLP